MADMNTDREVIEGALALIEADGGWTQGAYYRDADGTQIHPAADSPGNWVRVRTEHVGAGTYRTRTEPVAAPSSFCLGGALRIAADYWHTGQPYAVQQQVDRLELLLLRLANSADVMDWPDLDAFNDDVHTTAADAVLLLKHAAAQLVDLPTTLLRP
ncbi:hypothetical protein AU198_12840 [Mycobacterium sp. GA-1199]|uniref:DUF6197 family protein n=1 Tax=Mycobacterium sp. GA-1199 TaxID=1772287 RepID=UPI00074AD5CC|nr:hypothetical protein [Mycobacterium sp. GA-1199]KUI40620.1 hypothetical protein AU198_12840 [Mycobacterium sp. GA-1199]